MSEAKKILSDPILKRELIHLMKQANNVIMKIYDSKNNDISFHINYVQMDFDN